MDTEHRCRYWWALQVVGGKDVLDAGCGTGYGMQILAEAAAASVVGVDIDPEAVAEAAHRASGVGDVVEGDLRDLPMDDDSFDVAVCWETVEHVEQGERVLDELRRVLRPDGLLLVSSPNPAVYPPGNEHHVHEYRPAELASAVGERFAHVAGYRQHPWLASVVAPADGGSNGRGPSDNGAGRYRLRATKELPPDGETYGIVVASDAPLPRFDNLVALGDDFEVRWWTEAMEKAVREVTEAAQNAEAELRRDLARSGARESELRKRLEETSTALLDANQSLAQLTALRHRFEEAVADNLTLLDQVAVYERSTSWRVTAPFRRLGRLLRAGR